MILPLRVSGETRYREKDVMTPHGHFHWNELQTRDLAAAKKLYADSVGWTFEEMPMPDGTIYTSFATRAVSRLAACSISPRTPVLKACRRNGCPMSPSTTSMQRWRKPKLPARRDGRTVRRSRRWPHCHGSAARWRHGRLDDTVL
jgi:hypothetical protein